VLTTGSLQQLVYLEGQRVGRRAVVVGAEHVSFSAVHTLASTGTRVVAMITEHAAHQSYEPFRWLTAGWHEVPILVEHEVSRIDGRARVEAVEVTDRRSGERRAIECDTVVFTGDWIPEHELARRAGCVLDGGTRGPTVDQMLRSSRPGVFAAGNLLHGAETADVAALDGRRIIEFVLNYFRRGDWPARVPITVEPPLAWIFPSAIAIGSGLPPRERFILRAGYFGDAALVEVRQGRRFLHAQRFARLVPNRPLHLDASWLPRVLADEGPVRLLCSPTR
jgi:NADPH-dependent 2,4-dienoyl-CoA reductase/sulfur reductase-like enzyme